MAERNFEMNFEIDILFGIIFFINVTVHMIVDDLKANKLKIKIKKMLLKIMELN